MTTQVGQPSSGETVIIDLAYTPAPGFTGTATFTQTACNVAGTRATTVDTITVMPGDNRSPIAVDETISTIEDQPVTFDSTLNDIDPDNAIISPIVVSDPPRGVVVLDPPPISTRPRWRRAIPSTRRARRTGWRRSGGRG